MFFPTPFFSLYLLSVLLGKTIENKYEVQTGFKNAKQKQKAKHMSHFAYACKTERQNGISRLISEMLRTLDSSLRDRLFVLQNEVF